MFLRNMVFYTIAGSIIWTVSEFLGAGGVVSFSASLLVPPLLLLAFNIYKNR